MKIAFISTFFTGSTLPLMKHLSEIGHQTDLYLFCKQGGKAAETLRFDKPIHGPKIQQISKENQIYSYLKSTSNIYLAPYSLVRYRKYLVGFIPYFRNILLLKNIVSKLKKGKYDSIYVIVHEEHDAILCKFLKNNIFHNVFIAYHEVVESHVEKPRLKRVVEDTIKLDYPIITYSRHTQEILQKLSGKTDVHVTYFGPFEAYRLFDTANPLIGEPYILYIGSILPYKGLPFLYKTISERFLSPSFKVVIAGSGIDSTLDKIRCDNRFLLINKYVSDTDFANLIRYAKCVICPYVSGSQSGITQSAMVYGTPVIATNVGAFPEFVEDGKNGYLVNYGNTEELMAAITKVLDGQFLHGFVPDHLKWNNIAKHVEEILSRI